jgi:N-acetylmuramic acid 6-phosphate etherase
MFAEINMDHLQTEARNPASMQLDKLTPLEFVQLMNREDGQVVTAVGEQAGAIARAIELVADRLRAGGRLIYMGAGTSGRLGVLDASECPPTFSTPPELVVGLIAGGPAALTRAIEGAEDSPEQGAKDLDSIKITNKDVVVGIATSGRTPYVLGGMAHARDCGAFTIGLSCNTGSDLIAAVDLPVTPVSGPEVLSGSTRLKAGTATKLVLNMISTGAMVRLGKTYGNLMVDLRATNTKLRARTNRIVRQLTGVDEAAASELKTALVAQMAGVGPEEARTRLNQVGGQVRTALAQIEAGATRRHLAAPRASIPDLVLGVDGGGSHTIALLALPVSSGDAPSALSEPRILGRGEAGPSNQRAVGIDRALAELHRAVDAAFAAARLPRQPVARAVLGLAGAGRPDDQQVIRSWAERVRLADSVDVIADGALVIPAGTPRNWGLAIVAGTGSIVIGKTLTGATVRAGGWGYLLADEGSGYALVMEALRAAVRAIDGSGPATTLTERLLVALELNEPSELVAKIYGNIDRTALASLAPLVLEAAESGDTIARDIVRTQVRLLADCAVAAGKKLNSGNTPIDIACAGGLLVNSSGYREQVLTELRCRNLCLGTVATVSEPAKGAVKLAMMNSCQLEAVQRPAVIP